MTRIGCKMANSYRCDIYMCSDYIRSVCNTVFKNEKSVLLKVSSLLQVFVYLKYIQCAKMWKNVEKRGKTCISSTYLPKNVHLKVSITKKCAKSCKKHAKTCKNMQKRAKTCISNVFGPYSKTCIVKVRAS